MYFPPRSRTLALPHPSSIMSAPSKALTITMYRELLRGSERVRAIMRPGHVAVVGECVRRFVAETRSPHLTAAASLHGAACLPELTRSSFRGWADQPERAAGRSAAGSAIDDGFAALRLLLSLEAWIVESELATALP